MAQIFHLSELVAVVKGSGGANAIRRLPTTKSKVMIGDRVQDNLIARIPEQAGLIILGRPRRFAARYPKYPHQTNKHIWYYVRGISQGWEDGHAEVYNGWTAVSQLTEGGWRPFIDRPVQDWTTFAHKFGQALATHLYHDAWAYVLKSGGLPVYKQMGGPQTDTLSPGTVVVVHGGPWFKAGQLWWSVARPNTRSGGWVSEGDWQWHGKAGQRREWFEWYLAPLHAAMP